MKKGFTLIEIIACIALLGILGVSSILIVNKKTNNELQEITKKVLEAANVYVETEKDENGNNYLEEVTKGAKGVQVPISLLVDKGYIKDDVEDKIYNLKGEIKKDKESYYVMFLSDGTDYCKEQEITSLASWMKEGQSVYLCKNYDNNFENELSIKALNSSLKFKADLTKHAVSQEFYDNASEEDKANLTVENGLYTYYNEDGDRYIYNYYRGAVNNNYVKLGKDKDGNDLLWRIVWMRDDKRLKLVLDKTLPLTAKNEDGEILTLKSGDTIMLYQNSGNYCYSGNECYGFYTLNSECSTRMFGRNEYPRYDTCINSKENVINEFNQFSSKYQGTAINAYKSILDNWYNDDFILDNKDQIILTTNNFCYDDMYKPGESSNTFYDTVYYNDNFECYIHDKDDPDIGGIYSSSVSLLNYAEIIRAGISIKNISNKPDNYLLANSSDLTLAQVSKEYSYSSSYYYEQTIAGYNVENGILKSSTLFDYYKNDYYQMYTTFKTSNDEYFNVTWHDNYPRYYNISVNNLNFNRITKYNITTSDLKPVIVIDLNKVDLSDSSGTINDPYTLIEK